ncbi:hypothetical protein [Mucilaginibacter gotjawali]|uniref:Uncharacterized protein n=2 Tax=Mucilaginibacter gotjawali TaxID=1550579 RepID=A0A839SMR4_9SPHI|nr:hypothetical protein [Mucilaginibacter gotjawali]MBB3058130.1 hypothetical protein [Mucilaginibacter gotjawali]BAU52105.1 hypothetical protein MgSA37_00255 [Mucilaginibacter gotjawali]
MKLLLVIFFAATCTSASAQWYRVDQLLKKRATRTPYEDLSGGRYIARFKAEKAPHPKISPVLIDRSQYSLEASENVVMQLAQHNMRFRIYNDASYNFSELARLYVKQNRLSEAKWFLLQSNNISRQQNDDKHTIENLVELASIKATMGDVLLARQDLAEAHDLAYAKGLNQYYETIELATQYLNQNKQPKQRPVLIYADGAQNKTKAE